MRNIKKIMLVNLLLLALFVGARVLIAYVPNRRELLRRAQEAYAQNGESEADNRWAYFLINAEHPLPEDYAPALSAVQDTFMMDERCAAYAREMIAAAEADGVRLKVVSAYRSIQKQRENLDAYILRLENEGHSPDQAEKLAREEIAEPGTSEHNAGLALDILTEDWWDDHDDVTADFENTEEYLWLSAHAHEYGFILRYPKGYEKVTDYVYEPWHYRFVGVYYAERIRESGLPFEYYYISGEK
ncbi:MAG: M15 family metallopeptidase [Bacteroides sp.]|nr:M15 family metallopeptidase [Eubacterium sp.]MCM1417473.1 M15 family metallopeptidase [Roseburia sp.]MCM1461653.1 M15 family metallopeptidase [Bacteroides sp.]